MEESATKRRRTSPRTSIRLNAPTNNESTTPTETPPKATTRRAKRPSFASPTKASLAKHNPDILRRRQSATTARDELDQGASRPASRDDDSAAIDAQLHIESEAGATVATDNARSDSQRGGIRSDISIGSRNGRQSSTRRVGGAMARQPKRSPIKPHPRPLPPPGPEDDEDVLNTVTRRGHHGIPAGVIPTSMQEEPELPPTPEYPDPVLSTPPSGIHNTPSKRPRRSRAVAELINSSPSKRPPSKLHDMRLGDVGRSVPTPALKPPKTGKRDSGGNLRISQRNKPPDSDATKQALRDSLLEEVAQLEADLKVATEASEAALRAPREQQGGLHASRREELLNLLQRRALPQSNEPKLDVSAGWLQATLDPIAFLPFGKQISQLPNLFQQEVTPADEIQHAPPLSHHPTPMTAEDELPYLQAFSPLAFSSAISILRRDDPDTPQYQKHDITVRSTGRGLFTAGLEMTVNAKTLVITDLNVRRIEPAAMSELVPFIDRVLGQGSTSSALMRNVSIVTWAMSEWVRIATQRAEFWCTVERHLGDKTSLLETVASMRKRTRRKRRQRGHGTEPDDDDETAGQGEEGDHSGKESRLSRSELLPFMGRTSMELEIPTASSDDDTSGLRIDWRVEFDWTGEGKSRLGVQTVLPGKWHTADGRGSLAGIPALFDKMVQDKEEPMSAVKSIVALLAGEVAA